MALTPYQKANFRQHTHTQTQIVDPDTGDPIETGGGDAAAVTFTPAGNIAATNVQTAIQELDTEKSGTAHTHSYQPLDSDLTSIAALTTTSYGRALLELANQAALQTAVGAQPLDSDLTAIAALTTTSFGRGLLALADTAALAANHSHGASTPAATNAAALIYAAANFR